MSLRRLVLHFLFDAAASIILPHAPQGARINADRLRGLLQIVIGRPFYQVLQIKTDDGEVFDFVEQIPSRTPSFKLPGFITPELIDQVKDEGRKQRMFG